MFRGNVKGSSKERVETYEKGDTGTLNFPQVEIQVNSVIKSVLSRRSL